MARSDHHCSPIKELEERERLDVLGNSEACPDEVAFELNLGWWIGRVWWWGEDMWDRRLKLVIPVFFVDFLAGFLHRLTSRAGLEQRDTNVLCPLAWLSALLSSQGGGCWQMDSWFFLHWRIQGDELTLGMMIAPQGEGAGYLDTIWEAGKHLGEKDWRRGRRLLGASFPVEAKNRSQGQVHPPAQMETWGRGTWGLMGLLENRHCGAGAKSGWGDLLGFPHAWVLGDWLVEYTPTHKTRISQG